MHTIIGPVAAISAYTGQQRHRSWRITCFDGRVLWLKIENQDSPVAGVRSEAAAMRALAGATRVATFVHTGRYDDSNYLLTEELPGRAPNLADAKLIAAALHHFSTLLPCFPQQYRRGADVFCPTPDTARLLDLELLPTAAARSYYAVAAHVKAEAVALVHGSFDRENIVIDEAGKVGFLDLEATRPGPRSLDIACFADDLTSTAGIAEGRNWLNICALELGDAWNPVNVAGFLLLRLQFRRAATGRHSPAVTTLVQELV